MSKSFFAGVIKAALPATLGFLGGMTATFWPVYHAAFCTGAL